MAPLVIGLGNPFRGDDSVGLEVARRVRALAPALRVVEGDVEPVELLDLWSEADRVILIDAVSGDLHPGSVHRLEPLRRPLDVDLTRASTHAVSLADAVELARALDRLPGDLVVFGVAGARFEIGARMSPEVTAVVESVAVRVVAEATAAAEEGKPDLPG